MTSSLSAAWTCQQCRKPQRGAKRRTSTGRTVCAACESTQMSGALGMSLGGSTTEQAQSAVAIDRIRGWFRRATGTKG